MELGWYITLQALSVVLAAYPRPGPHKALGALAFLFFLGWAIWDACGG